MSSPRFSDAAWYRTQTLTERLAIPEPFVAPTGAERPEWLLTLEQAFEDHSPANPATLQALTGALAESQRSLAGFLNLVAPLIDQGRRRLRQGIQRLRRDHPGAPFTEGVEQLLLASLPAPLLSMLHRTLILELNVCRIQDRLTGETPRERFLDFVHLLARRDVALELLEEYPVLARQLVNAIRQWGCFSLEFLTHLAQDWMELGAFMRLPPGDELTALEVGAGDTHNDGRSVILLGFNSGARLVYKPRSLAVELHFQHLLTWLNARGMEPAFRTLKVLTRDTYGWVEFVAAEGCQTPEELERFYTRQGAYLALLHAISATDFHSENLIAAGEHPILTDLEALFHPPPQRIAGEFEPQVVRQMMSSVMGVGLLPGRAWLDTNSDGLEISGLAGGLPQMWPHATPIITGSGTDTMRLARQRVMSEGSANRPTLQGQHVDVARYAAPLMEGFIRLYRLLRRHGQAFCATDGPLSSFVDDEIRVVLRTTHGYSLMRQESYHPDLLRDALDRERFFDKLRVGVADLATMDPVLAAERADLDNGDIPMFTTRPRSRDLWSHGHGCIPGFLETTALEHVQRRLRTFNEEDLSRQLWFIQASFTTLAMGGERAVWTRYPRREPAQEASRERLLATARTLGDRLERIAVRGEQDIGWVGLTIVNDRYWSLVPTSIDLYSGTAGIALFLGYLGHVTGEARYTHLAKLSLTTARQLVERDREQVKQLGGYFGWGGFLYAMTHLGGLWREPSLWTEAEAVLPHLEPLIDGDESFDVLTGSAGTLLSLLGLHGVQGSRAALDAAIRCGERLLAMARPMREGTGWYVKGVAEWPLSGFSHGAAGIALSLLELATTTGDSRFRETACRALDYERSLFSTQARNWADLRVPENTPSEERNSRFSVGWCHGAPGIGMARLGSMRHLDDPRLKADAEAAVQTTLEHGFGMNHSLCHGDLGNLELILLASQAFGDGALKSRAYRLAHMILDNIDERGWQCGVPLGVETPGLMTGLAGIGYGLLRLASPEQVPSVLTLAPPPPRQPHADARGEGPSGLTSAPNPRLSGGSSMGGQGCADGCGR
ncbi:type 2 lanthipeptide synthetase LanM family protein [Melittangium boletus]|uniref:Type 2 lantibiotic biosynthesis protein LanM n=1 Tax=Melittangium boletus DSM 14713 TaxID=1294270 RepID=A0A250IN54_9BACT|nr:type 2 lanthipeptide synthetase LanM family protein [Melittangium boletus]ATB32683.1 type 2 lantibiotic biosynthesis protein LanM [Melittangium boletus DSM 14713]